MGKNIAISPKRIIDRILGRTLEKLANQLKEQMTEIPENTPLMAIGKKGERVYLSIPTRNQYGYLNPWNWTTMAQELMELEVTKIIPLYRGEKEYQINLRI
jgi:hypothetical protein